MVIFFVFATGVLVLKYNRNLQDMSHDVEFKTYTIVSSAVSEILVPTYVLSSILMGFTSFIFIFPKVVVVASKGA
jgi:hypothetical protein